MAESSVSQDAPVPAAIEHVFVVYEVERVEGEIRYYGSPRVPLRELIREVWPLFRDAGYDVKLTREYGEWILIAEPVSLGVNGIPWTNLILGIATVGSTLFAGAFWYHLDPYSLEIIHAWPFALTIMFVLGVHELGHYALSRYHQVNASLPYFIPVPTLIGTMGAVIKMEGQIPSRKALFDIGVAGPLAGLAATIGVTLVGLQLPPVEVPEETVDEPGAVIELGYPPLLEGLAWLSGQSAGYSDPSMAVNPVVIAGWVGMFITFLNMIPVGQLDGGHILRAILGERQPAIAALVPGLLLGLAAYLHFISDIALQGVLVWGIWGVLTALFLAVGPAQPIDDRELGTGRILLGVLTFVLALLCFTPVPIQVHM